jgi:hypothetical protein
VLSCSPTGIKQTFRPLLTIQWVHAARNEHLTDVRHGSDVPGDDGPWLIPEADNFAAGRLQIFRGLLHR